MCTCKSSLNHKHARSNRKGQSLWKTRGVQDWSALWASPLEIKYVVMCRFIFRRFGKSSSWRRRNVMCGKLRSLSYGQPREICHLLELLQTRRQRGVGLMPYVHSSALYLPTKGVCPASTPSICLWESGKPAAFWAVPDPFASKFNERTSKKLSRSCWQYAAT